MGMRRYTNRLTAWIACMAILLAALAPSVSHAIAAVRINQAAVQEICSTESGKHAHHGEGESQTQIHAHAEDASEHHGPGQELSHFKHCPFCSSGTHSFAIPMPEFSLPVLSGEHIVPRLFHQSSRPLFAWAAAQPRGPPSLS